jgi:beta-lactamase superfamily II metal-dependent hydrolase
MRKHSGKVLLGFALLASLGSPLWVAAQAQLEVRFLDVGQADAILLRCPDGDHYMLIDSGDTRYPGSSAAFRAALRAEFKDKPRPWKIALAVASHPHADHIGSMKWVLETFDVDTYVDNGQRNCETTLCAKLDQVRKRQVKNNQLTYISGKQLGFADLDFCPRVGVRLLVPWAVRNLADTNDRSVILRVSFGKTSFLFTGDAHDNAEKVMLNHFGPEDRAALDVTVLKAGHHGSDTSSGSDFIAAVSPQTVVISSGKKEVGTNVKYKHPRLSTLRNLDNWLRSHDPTVYAADGRVWAYNAQQKRWEHFTRPLGLWVTAVDGIVNIRSDGERLDIVTGKNNLQMTLTPP